MKAVVFVLLVALATSYHVRTEHQYWYTANKGAAQSGVPFADVAWNYCDLKCISLEKIYPGNDFYVINFKDVVYKPNFSACYVKAPGATNPDLWSKVAKNDFYDKNCGGDTEDYLKNSVYTKISEEGVGIGVKITYWFIHNRSLLPNLKLII